MPRKTEQTEQPQAREERIAQQADRLAAAAEERAERITARLRQRSELPGTTLGDVTPFTPKDEGGDAGR